MDILKCVCMKQRLIIIEDYLRTLGSVPFVLLFVILTIVAAIPFQLTFGGVEGVGPSDIKVFSFEIIFAVLFFSPIIETLFFQGFVFNQTLKFTKQNYLVAIILSSFLFGMAHPYSINYALLSFAAGIVLGTAKILREKYALHHVIVIHSLRNLIGLLAIAYL